MTQSEHISSAKIWRGGFAVPFLLLTLSACGDDGNSQDEAAMQPDDAAVYVELAAQPVLKAEEQAYPGYERSARAERVAKMEVDAAVGAEAFQVCATCHGEDGFGSRDGTVPRLAGQHRAVLLFRLIEIAEGVRVREEMEAYKPAIRTDEQIAALATHIEALPDPLEVRHGPGEGLDVAGTQFSELCASCHGAKGEGHSGDGIPRIGGWDFPSVERTLLMLQSPDAEIHETGMSDLVSMLTREEVSALADFVSRLDPKSDD